MTAETFSPSTAAQLDRAEALCHARGSRMTDLRREVLGLVLESKGPAGAYELLERLRATRGGAAPPTVYRALDFLLEQGFVHRVERLAAFVGCIEAPLHSHAAHIDGAPSGHGHAAQFLICRRCGQVTEIDDHALAAALGVAARAVGFTVTGATIEAEGICARCAGAG